MSLAVNLTDAISASGVTNAVGAFTTAAKQFEDFAAPLDALLIDAAIGPVRRLAPDGSTVEPAVKSAGSPKKTARRLAWPADPPIEPGSWWPHFAAWLETRCGPGRRARPKLGGPGLPPLIQAPGTHVLDH